MFDLEQFHALLLGLAAILGTISIIGIFHRPALQWWRGARVHRKSLQVLSDTLQKEIEDRNHTVHYGRHLPTRLRNQWLSNRHYPPLHRLEDAHGVGHGTLNLLQARGVRHLGQIKSEQQLMSVDGIGPHKAAMIMQAVGPIIERWQWEMEQAYENEIKHTYQEQIEHAKTQAQWAHRCLKAHRKVELTHIKLLSWRGGLLYSLKNPAPEEHWTQLETQLNQALKAIRGETLEQLPVMESNTTKPSNEETRVFHAQEPPRRGQWLEVLRNDYSPTDFEKYVASLWEALGYEAHLTPSTGDHGADVIATRPNERVVIECKRYAIGASVGNKVVRGVVAHKSDLNHPATHAVVVTTGQFTKKAIEAGEKFGVELIGPDELTNLIEQTNVLPVGASSNRLIERASVPPIQAPTNNSFYTTPGRHESAREHNQRRQNQRTKKRTDLLRVIIAVLVLFSIVLCLAEVMDGRRKRSKEQARQLMIEQQKQLDRAKRDARIKYTLANLSKFVAKLDEHLAGGEVDEAQTLISWIEEADPAHPKIASSRAQIKLIEAKKVRLKRVSSAKTLLVDAEHQIKKRQYIKADKLYEEVMSKFKGMKDLSGVESDLINKAEKRKASIKRKVQKQLKRRNKCTAVSRHTVDGVTIRGKSVITSTVNGSARPLAGNMFLTFSYTLKNTTSYTVDDPMVSSVLIDSNGKRFINRNQSGAASYIPEVQPRTKIPTFITFEVPDDLKIRKASICLNGAGFRLSRYKIVRD